MKVLVSDVLGEVGIKMFQDEPGLEVDVKTGLAPDELKSIIGEYDALVIRSATQVTEEILQAAKALKVVGRAGIGLDNVDIPAATKRGVVVMNTPTGNVITTAEHTIAMMMALTRNIPWGTSTLKSGLWEKKKLQGREVFNKVLGVIGIGKIGSIVADRARGLKMRVIVHDSFVAPEQIEKAGFESVSLDELYRRADYITLHVPKLKDTLGLLNKAAFEKMKDGVMIINCARGGIVDEADLNEALLSGKVAGAALDVFEHEPPGVCPLFEVDRVICTPHLGASTREAQTNVAVQVAEQIIAYLKGGTIINAVNVPAVSGELLEKIGRLLTPMIKDDVNFVNAEVLAKERGIKVTATTIPEADEFINLITVKAYYDDGKSKVAGTIFGQKDPRVVNINNFRLELHPHDRFILIHNHDKPGAIGSIGNLLGDHKINISRMRVGQEEGGDKTMIFLRTNEIIPEDVMEKLRQLPLNITVSSFEL